MNLKSVVLPPTLFNFTITAATLWSRVIVVVAKNYQINAEISNRKKFTEVEYMNSKR